MSHSGRGMYEYTRPFPGPGGRGRGKVDGSWGDRHPSTGRPQSIDEEIDIVSTPDEEMEREKEKVREREKEEKDKGEGDRELERVSGKIAKCVE